MPKFAVYTFLKVTNLTHRELRPGGTTPGGGTGPAPSLKLPMPLVLVLWAYDDSGSSDYYLLEYSSILLENNS